MPIALSAGSAGSLHPRRARGPVDAVDAGRRGPRRRLPRGEGAQGRHPDPQRPVGERQGRHGGGSPPFQASGPERGLEVRPGRLQAVMHACSYPFCSALLFAMSVIVSCSTIRTKGSMHRCAVCVHDHVRTTSSLLVVASQPGEEESTLCCASLAWHASHTPCTHCFAVNDRTPARACESSYMGPFISGNSFVSSERLLAGLQRPLPSQTRAAEIFQSSEPKVDRSRLAHDGNER